jgi:hypothetical protein
MKIIAAGNIVKINFAKIFIADIRELAGSSPAIDE